MKKEQAVSAIKIALSALRREAKTVCEEDPNLLEPYGRAAERLEILEKMLGGMTNKELNELIKRTTATKNQPKSFF